jgi:hypothetical protein
MKTESGATSISAARQFAKSRAAGRKKAPRRQKLGGAGGEAGGGRGLGQAMELNAFQALIDEANCLRGKIIAGYSFVEFVLADISVLLDLHFPYPIEARIKAAKKIVDRPEYEAYRNDFHRVCNEFPRYEELRHFIAHGAMILGTDSKFELHLY